MRPAAALRRTRFLKTIDMNDFYVDPLLYGNPPQTEVSDEVAEALWQFMRDEQAADRRVRRAKAYYSLDCGDGIEYAAVFRMETPEEHYERKLTIKQLNTALAMLPIKQGQYIYARYFLGKSNAEIARAEKITSRAVRKSVRAGLRSLAKILKNFC